MVTTERWKQAQQYEAGYWDRLGEEIADGSQEQFDWYGWRADQLVQRLDKIGYRKLTDGSARVIEVGSGPVGVTSFFPASAAVRRGRRAPQCHRCAACEPALHSS